MPHVYFAECNGEYYLSVLAKLSAGKILSRPRFNNGILSFSVKSGGSASGDWICRRSYSAGSLKGIDTLTVAVEGGGSTHLIKGEASEEQNDYMTHEPEFNKNTLWKNFPHIHSEFDNNDVSVTVCQISSLDVKFNIDGEEIEVSPQGEQIQGYNIYVAEGTVSGKNARISAEDLDAAFVEEQARKKRRPRRKKAKLRHSY